MRELTKVIPIMAFLIFIGFFYVFMYFFIDDYSTASNFWLLSKTFNKKYMSYYNKPYEHKYNILYNNIFTFYLYYLNGDMMSII